MMNILKKVLYKILRYPLNKKMRKRLKNSNITIISQNCTGGVLYHDLGLEFLSPTINMFIEGENFVKLVENLEHYLNMPAEPLTDEYVDPVDNTIKYPKIKIGDIELCCLHYKKCSEAIQCWERRKHRVNVDNVFVIGNSWNLQSDVGLVRRLSKIKYKTIIFTTDDCFIDNGKCVKLSDKVAWKKDLRGIVRPNLTDYVGVSAKRYYEIMFDFVGWFNCEE